MSDNVPPGAFRFLDLPIDIRLMVYEEYFVPTTRHHAIDLYNPVKAEYHTSDLHECHHGLGPIESTLTLIRTTVPSALLRTNRTIHREAQDFRKRQLFWVPMPEIAIQGPCYSSHDEISYLLGLICGLVCVYKARPIGIVKLGDVAEGVRGLWRRDGWKFLDGESSEDVVKVWATEVIYRMATEISRTLSCRVSWPDLLLARHPGWDILFVGAISKYLDQGIYLKRE